jgi:hypothetical protein
VPRLSVIIPHISSDAALETTILSVLENRPHGIELIVAHGGNYEDPYHLDEDELCLVNASSARDVVGLINFAVRYASGNVIQTLLPGMRVDSNWTSSALAWFHDATIAAVSPSSSSSVDNDDRLFGLDVRCLPRRIWSTKSRRGEEIGATLAGGFYRRSVIEAMQGWIESTSREAAEAEMGLAIQALGLRSIAEPSSQLISEQRIVEGEVGGYAQGHLAGQIAWAYSQATGVNLVKDSLAARLGHLAGGLMKPSSVAERLGWVFGMTDRTLVSSVHNRLELARKTMNRLRSEASSSQATRRAA